MNRKLAFSGVLLTFLCFCTSLQASECKLVPKPGSPLRKAILNSLRQEMKRLHGFDLVFVVRHMRAKNGSAWVDTDPQSKDGSGRYEAVSALLQLKDNKWKVVEMPCLEVDCLQGPAYFAKLKERFPDVDKAILPYEECRTND